MLAPAVAYIRSVIGRIIRRIHGRGAVVYITSMITLPLVVGFMGEDIYEALKKYTSALVRFVLYSIIIILSYFFVEDVDTAQEDDKTNLVPSVTGPSWYQSFEIPHKVASNEALENWRKAALVLNPSRRFRYVADIVRRQQLEQRQELRVAGLTTQAALRYVDSLPMHRKADHSTTVSDGELNADTLSSLVEKEDVDILKSLGGIQGICHKLNVDPKKGLTDGQREHNQEEFGSNTYSEKPFKGFFAFVLEACQDLTLMILLVCALVSFGFGIATEGMEEGWYDGTGILSGILLVVLVTAFSDYQQSLQFRDLDKEKNKIYIQVTRDGHRTEVSILDLVVGDIVHLSIGDKIPADGLLIDGDELTVDETAMTGESQPQHKSPERKPFLLSGTKVQDGSGLMLITGVGMNTEWGHLMATVGGEDDSETPLQVKLSGLATFIGKLGLGFALLSFLVLLGRFLYSKYTSGGITEWGGEDAVTIVKYLTIHVAIIVVAVPEGFPLAVTLTLAFAMKKMMLDKVLVRHLAACETMGATTAICVGIIKDPVREGVPKAVKLLSSAGMKVRMFTEENIQTARAVAHECGILTDGDVVESSDVHTWTEEERDIRISNIQVVARCSPSDKLTLVRHLQKLGEVVAVVGDGMSNAPAVHEADIALAMGSATQVVKESADVIVLDDHFGTVVFVAKWGRLVCASIQKCVQFQFTAIMVALVVNFTSVCMTGEAPLTAIQLLWVHLIIEPLGGLALATEPLNDDLLKKKASGRKGAFFTNVMWRNLLGQVIYQVVVLDVLHYEGKDILHLEGSEREVNTQLTTIIFNAFVFCQVFNLINAREMEKLNVFGHIFDNWVFLLIINLIVVFQCAMVGFLGKLANTVPLTWNQWSITVGVGAFSVLVAIVGKLTPVPAKELPWITDRTQRSFYEPLPREPPELEENV